MPHPTTRALVCATKPLALETLHAELPLAGVPAAARPRARRRARSGHASANPCSDHIGAAAEADKVIERRRMSLAGPKQTAHALCRRTLYVRGGTFYESLRRHQTRSGLTTLGCWIFAGRKGNNPKSHQASPPAARGILDESDAARYPTRSHALPACSSKASGAPKAADFPQPTAAAPA